MQRSELMGINDESHTSHHDTVGRKRPSTTGMNRTRLATAASVLFGCVAAMVACEPTKADSLSSFASDPIINPMNGRVYRLGNPTTWWNLNLAGTPLVTVNDGTENTWVATYLAGPHLLGFDKGVWLGINDFAQEGNWVWKNGQPVTYVNWAPGEPNNVGDEDAALISGGSGQWVDLKIFHVDWYVTEEGRPACPGAGSCATAHDTPGCDIESCCNLICSFDPSCCDVAWDAQCALSASFSCYFQAGAPVVNPANGHTYYRIAAGRFHEAEKFARGLFGHLATINDAAENEWVRQNLVLPGIPQFAAYIGLNDEAVEGVFTWISTEASTYTNWAPGAPRGPGSEFYDFAMMAPDGLWGPAGNIDAVAIVEVPCTGDLNDDAKRDAADLAILLGAWGRCGSCAADINLDGMVDASDIAILLGAWGNCATSDCCSPHNAGCDQPGCQLCVCGFDPFCCEVTWDAVCVDQAANQCNGACQCSEQG
jgi:hypothetical protein